MRDFIAVATSVVIVAAATAAQSDTGWELLPVMGVPALKDLERFVGLLSSTPSAWLRPRRAAPARRSRRADARRRCDADSRSARRRTRAPPAPRAAPRTASRASRTDEAFDATPR